MHGWTKHLLIWMLISFITIHLISVNKCGGSCNTIEDPFGRICVPNKIEDVNLTAFNMFQDTNESKTLAKHISCDARCEFDGKKWNSRQKWDNNKCQMSVKNLAQLRSRTA